MAKNVMVVFSTSVDFFSQSFLSLLGGILFAITSGQELECPSNEWSVFGDSCYYVDSASVQSWDSANKMCQTLGGETSRLASVYR